MENNTTYNQEGRKILFTVWYAEGFHGAVIHISEIAEYLISKGWNVYCVCTILSEDIKKYFSSKGIKIFAADCCDYSIEYDIIWNIHFPIFMFLLKNNIRYKKIIFNALSPFLEIEAPPCCYEAYSTLLAVSEETKDKLVNYYNIPRDKISVLKNIVPLSYFTQHKTYNKSVKKIVIVSNHLPQELLDSIPLFREKGIECNIIGRNFNYIPVCPQVLSQYDVIITIGKTVQYSLALGIPCYNYDYWGGVGYITENNLKREEYYNFSGRPHKTKKTSIEIVSEIIDEYNTAFKSSRQLKDIAEKKYGISSQIDPIIDHVLSSPKKEINLKEYSIIIDQYYFLVHAILTYYSKKNKNPLNKNQIKKLFYIESEPDKNSKHLIIQVCGIRLKFKLPANKIFSNSKKCL